MDGGWSEILYIDCKAECTFIWTWMCDDPPPEGTGVYCANDFMGGVPSNYPCITTGGVCEGMLLEHIVPI